MVFACLGAVFWAAVSPFRCVFWGRAGNAVSSYFGRVSDDTTYYYWYHYYYSSSSSSSSCCCCYLLLLLPTNYYNY